MKHVILFLLSLLLISCVGIPEGIEPTTNFEVNRYLGKWYEIARLENRFEQGLDKITAEYSLRDDGGLAVINSGIKVDTGKRDSVEGKAYFTGSSDVGSLKVSFFGPFYGAYNIIALDKEHYSFVMITGSDRDYLWILSRTPKLDEAVLKNLVSKAKGLGFETDKLIFPKQ
ncbi:MAG: lipocalin family protein [Methyloglobulus sp.]|nr:lipocalin [Methyloglobulus sp.]